MLRKPWFRWPLTIVLCLFAFLNLQQGLTNLLSNEDWSDSYLIIETSLVDSIEVESPGSSTDTRNIQRVTCTPILEFVRDGRVHRAEAPWLIERYNRFRGGECMGGAYGQVIPAALAGTNGDPIILDPVNLPASSSTGFIGILLGVLFLLSLWWLWRGIRPKEGSSTKID